MVLQVFERLWTPPTYVFQADALQICQEKRGFGIFGWRQDGAAVENLCFI